MRLTKNIFVLILLAIPFGLAACTDRTGTNTTDTNTTDTNTTNMNTPEYEQNNPNDTGFDEANRLPASSTNRATNSTADSTTNSARTQTNNSLNNTEVPLTDDQYRQAQNALKNLGYTVSDSPRGGPETTRAIQDFQNENNIPSTGNFDKVTLSRLGVLIEDRQPASLNQNQRQNQ